MSVTLKEIAAEAGVSIYTVSRVLNGKNKEAYQPAARRAEKIRDVARRMGFIPNASARAMRRSGQTKVIGLLVPEIYFASIVDFETMLGLNQRLEDHGYLLTLIRSTEVSKPARDLPDELSDEHDQAQWLMEHPSPVFQERMLDGMVVMGLIPPAMCQLVSRITPACLWLDTNITEENNNLRRDEYEAGRLLAKQMLRRGYRKIIAVLPSYPEEPVRHYSFSERVRGVMSVVQATDVPVQEELLRYIEDDEFTIAPLLEQIKDQLAPDVAIMAATDRVAISLLVEMASLGIRPGVDVGIAACDRTRWTQSHWPNLSCVDVQRFDLGTQAADMIVSIIKSPKHNCKSKTIKWGWHEGKTLPAVK
jgi:LacI family transcriptional regulator